MHLDEWHSLQSYLDSLLQCLYVIVFLKFQCNRLLPLQEDLHAEAGVAGTAGCLPEPSLSICSQQIQDLPWIPGWAKSRESSTQQETVSLPGCPQQ